MRVPLAGCGWPTSAGSPGQGTAELCGGLFLTSTISIPWELYLSDFGMQYNKEETNMQTTAQETPGRLPQLEEAKEEVVCALSPNFSVPWGTR